MLTIENLNQYYAESHTLWDLSLSIKEKCCTCLMGRNGVGKTTLLNCIMGLVPVKSGAIYFQGDNIIKKRLSTGRVWALAMFLRDAKFFRS